MPKIHGFLNALLKAAAMSVCSGMAWLSAAGFIAFSILGN
jgi:hypothetical protein